ncbi:hypothetical protein EW145_g1723 [Phellinidium pouzarii]|uniref:Fungal-type protein kinase domain-containing protein n=1 Tax=Phellinidium pouzarii TaxID=167371 RepID=A0A4S4LE10_9AGAM|nr:hypothetical protein EW145_g1723 [Phellinidium pouzarii]
MDIFNRPPAISEDTLQYALYPSPEAADRAAVTGLAALIEALVTSLIPAHIWHRDAFELKVVPDSGADLDNRDDEDRDEDKSRNRNKSADRWMLEGRMRVGDSVDDEWCIVWFLREVSTRWDVAITVFDSDGEFLLIEAAEHLPSWVTPSNSENRVWIYRSNLHLIPLSYLSPPSTRSKRRRRLGGNESDDGENFGDDGDGEESWLNVQDALHALRSNNGTKAPLEVQDAVWKRISGYPDAARQHVHITKAFLPVDIAKALTEEPSLIQRATETFYTRDAIQLRAAHRMSRFPPQNPVLTPVRMTRTAYAQLVGQKFHPPKVFGQFKEREETREWRWRDVGMKIACGFEMLYQESKSRAEGTSLDIQKVSADARKDALRRNPEYIEYIEKLASTGYFREEIEGSKLWNELEHKAVDVFVKTRRDDNASRSSFATLVNFAAAQAGESSTLSKLEEDSDDWLNIDAENFDDKLAETMRSDPAKLKPLAKNKDAMDVDQSVENEDRQAEVQAEKLQGLAKKIEKFVEGEGTLEGAVFDDEHSEQMSEDEQLSDFSDEEYPEEDSEEEKPQVVHEEDQAAKAARQEAMDKLVPALDPEDYGQMPAQFYENSQRVAPVTMETETRDEVAPSASMKEPTTEVQRQPKPIRRPILPRDDFDGVDSDDDTDEDDAEAAGEESDESDEDRPQVVGEIEIDMGAEQEEFLEFSRTALGIPDEMWGDILSERRGRGAFVPEGFEVNKSQRGDEKYASQSITTATGPRLRTPQAGPRPNVNPNLDSFEAVMEAMEAELATARLAKKALRKGKGPPKAGDTGNEVDMDLEDEDGDLEAVMEAELRAALEHEEGDSGDEEPMDYGMIKNFLESFKSQAGLAGPYIDEELMSGKIMFSPNEAMGPLAEDGWYDEEQKRWLNWPNACTLNFADAVANYINNLASHVRILLGEKKEPSRKRVYSTRYCGAGLPRLNDQWSIDGPELVMTDSDVSEVGWEKVHVCDEMALYIFDRSGVLATERFNIHAEPEGFVRITIGLLLALEQTRYDVLNQECPEVGLAELESIMERLTLKPGTRTATTSSLWTTGWNKKLELLKEEFEDVTRLVRYERMQSGEGEGTDVKRKFIMFGKMSKRWPEFKTMIFREHYKVLFRPLGVNSDDISLLEDFVIGRARLKPDVNVGVDVRMAVDEDERPF